MKTQTCRTNKRWTVQDDNILKKIILEHPETIRKQLLKAAEVLGVSYSACSGRYNTHLYNKDTDFKEQIIKANRRSRVQTMREKAVHKNPKVAVKLRRLIKENPGNLSHAFRLIAEEFGVQYGTIHSAYYGIGYFKNDKNNLLYRFLPANKSFFLLGSSSGYNMKNFNGGHKLTSNKVKEIIKTLFPRFKK